MTTLAIIIATTVIAMSVSSIVWIIIIVTGIDDDDRLKILHRKKSIFTRLDAIDKLSYELERGWEKHCESTREIYLLRDRLRVVEQGKAKLEDILKERTDEDTKYIIVEGDVYEIAGYVKSVDPEHAPIVETTGMFVRHCVKEKKHD